MQVEVVSWTQSDGEDHYLPTRDLLVNPPLFTVPPGRSQVLRVGLRRPPSGEREAAYRLFLREVPPPGLVKAEPAASGQGKVLVLLQMRLPVYVPPVNVVSAQQWQAVRTEDGAIRVKLNNSGNVHVVVNQLKLRPADAGAETAPLAATSASAAVLAGQSRSWLMRPQAEAPGQRYTLEVTTDRGRQNVALDPGRP